MCTPKVLQENEIWEGGNQKNCFGRQQTNSNATFYCLRTKHCFCCVLKKPNNKYTVKNPCKLLGA